MTIWDYWEQAFRPKDQVDVRVKDEWVPGTVDQSWRPASGFGVTGWLDGDRGQFRAVNADDIRPRWASLMPARGDRVLLTTELSNNIYTWPATVRESLSDNLALVELDGFPGTPVIAKAWMMRRLETPVAQAERQ